MKPQEELHFLRARLQALESQLSFLEGRMREIGHRYDRSFFKAFVDSGRCLGCGACEAYCPTGAIITQKTAWIDAQRCIGCGRCVEVCPQGAISFRDERLNRIEETGRKF